MNDVDNAKALMKKKTREEMIKEHDKLMKDCDLTAFNFNCSSLFRGLVFGKPEDYKKD